MKIGVRKPSIKKSIKARTTGKLKRTVKKAVIPGYGKKGTGIIKDPKKAIYNKVYNKTTVGVKDLIPTSSKQATDNIDKNNISITVDYNTPKEIKSMNNKKVFFITFLVSCFMVYAVLAETMVFSIVDIIAFLVTSLLLSSIIFVIIKFIHILKSTKPLE